MKSIKTGSGDGTRDKGKGPSRGPGRQKVKARDPKPGWRTRSKGNANEVASQSSRDERPGIPGLAARDIAAGLIDRVLARRQTLDEALSAEDATGRLAALDQRDRAFTRLIAATVLRRLGSLSAVLTRFIERPLPDEARRAKTILLLGAAQILLLATPPHAAINLAVEQMRRDRASHRYAKLGNAVLRRVANEGPVILASLDATVVDIPDWIFARWSAAYGDDGARQIAAASLAEAPLDLTLKAPDSAVDWAERLGGRLLATGSVRLADHGRIEDLPGYAEGAWWVQDAAAALPQRLLGDVAGRTVADLCAAPGGKTAALAAAGACVVAVDASAKRLERLRANITRLGLAGQVETVVADIGAWTPPALFDLILLDAPCTATGTIRRHPDLLHLKRPDDIARLAGLQALLLAKAAAALNEGGRLVYCTCSLEPEEGADQIERFLAGHPTFAREPIRPQEARDAGMDPAWLSPIGDLRTLPCHAPRAPDGAPVDGGMDGFYAARLVRRD